MTKIDNITKIQSAFEKDVKSEWETFTSKVEQKAETIFHEIVKPFCRERKWRFLPGNGDWAFFPPNHRAVADPQDWDEDDAELGAVCDLLHAGIPGMPSNDLGSMMPDYQDYTEKEEA